MNSPALALTGETLRRCMVKAKKRSSGDADTGVGGIMIVASAAISDEDESLRRDGGR